MDHLLLFELDYKDNNIDFIIPSVKDVKDFSENKFKIFIDNMNETPDFSNNSVTPQSDCTDSSNDNPAISFLFKKVGNSCQGYSLSHLKDSLYENYTHRPLPVSWSTIDSCEKQLEYHCILQALYNILYFKKRDFKDMLKVAKKYTEKRYYTLNPTNQMIPIKFNGYSGDNNASGNKLRNAFDHLYLRRTSEKTLTHQSLIEYIWHNRFFTSPPQDTDNSAPEKNVTYTRRYVSSFIDELSYDLIINSLTGGFNFELRLNSLKRNQQKTEVFRREVQKFMRGLSILDGNLTSIYKYQDILQIPLDTEKNTFVEKLTNNLLYYYSKEAYFHTTLFNYIMSGDIRLNHLRSLLTMPVVPNLTPFVDLFSFPSDPTDSEFLITYLSEISFPVYSQAFFITLCEHYNFNSDKIYKALVEYLIKYPIEFIFPDPSIDFTSAKGKTASLLGNAILEYYNSPICQTSFDTSFYVNINDIGPETPDLAYIQASIATAYYENILK